jgi:RNA polymerase sigma-70 factor (ECF subfamily)
MTEHIHFSKSNFSRATPIAGNDSGDNAGAVLATLIERTACGDRAAFRQLYETCSPRLLTVARRLLRRTELAEEIVQDAFVALWEHAADFDRKRAHPMGWLTSIVRHRALDMLRRPHVEVAIEDDSWLESVASNVGSAEAEWEARAARSAVQSALATLPPSQRQAVALSFQHGLSHSEMAVHLRRPLGTVKTLARRGLARLAETLARAPNQIA